MHDTAYRIGKLFLDIYWQDGFKNIVDLGSCDVNGTLRDFCPPGAVYTGLDLEAGAGVDVCVRPHERLPLCDEFADVVVTSSVFEHDELFWETFIELVRITRRGGLIYINAPTNGPFHRYPVDCWRFYPDAGAALVRWAARSGHDIELVESCVAARERDVWNDFVAIFHRRGAKPLGVCEFLTDRIACSNIRRQGEDAVRRQQEETEDMALLQERAREIQRLGAHQARITELEAQMAGLKSSLSWRVTLPLRAARASWLRFAGRHLR